jgi:ribose 5-phosphate isomerase B
MLYLASDHAGFRMKDSIIKELADRNIPHEDFGTFSAEMVDFPIYARRVTQAVLKHKGLGILVCGTGAGMAIAANRSKGIRAAVAWNEEVAKRIREEDDVNVLCLPARIISSKEAWSVMTVFLATTFASLERYNKRIKELDER